MAKSKKNGWVSWSEDEVKLLKKLFPQGRAREIAEQTGRPLDKPLETKEADKKGRRAKRRAKQ